MRRERAVMVLPSVFFYLSTGERGWDTAHLFQYVPSAEGGKLWIPCAILLGPPMPSLRGAKRRGNLVQALDRHVAVNRAESQGKSKCKWDE
jgi:hypothetical protein